MKQFSIDKDTIIFNTMRPYSDEGQIIIAERQPNGMIVAVDISRGIALRLTASWFHPTSIDNIYMFSDMYTYDVDRSVVRRLTDLANIVKHEVAK